MQWLAQVARTLQVAGLILVIYHFFLTNWQAGHTSHRYIFNLNPVFFLQVNPHATSAGYVATSAHFTSINEISTVFACSCQVVQPVQRIFQVHALKWTYMASWSTSGVIIIIIIILRGSEEKGDLARVRKKGRVIFAGLGDKVDRVVRGPMRTRGTLETRLISSHKSFGCFQEFSFRLSTRCI